MKKLYSIALLLISLSGIAQVPQAINYQGVARNASGIPITGPIGVKVDIHVAAGNGPIVCSEVFNVTANQFGVFDLRIGTASPVQFGLIPWGTAKFFVGIAIDPTGGSTFGPEITNQELVSVPYALYAEKAGNAGGSATITSSFPSIISVNSAPLSHTVNYTPPQLLLTSDTVLRIVQGAHTSSAVIIKGAGATATSVPGAHWNGVANNVFLAVGSNNVGIGTSTPTAKLEVSANPFSTNNAIAAYAQGGNGVLALTSSTSNLNAAVIGSNSGSGSGIIGVTLANNGISAGVQGNHNGNGPGVYGSNTMSSTAATAHGVVGETNSQSTTAAGVIGINNGQGPGVYGYQGQSTGGPGVWGVSNSTSEAGVKGIANSGAAGVTGEVASAVNSPGASGVVGRTNSPNNAASGVHGQNTGAGNGVTGIASANTFTSYAVFGKNVGQGGGVYGEAFTNGGMVAGVHGNQLGIGPALRGTMPTATNAASPNVALLIENGHIQATSLNAPTLTFANITGTTIGIPSLVAGSNDVRGMVLAPVTATANWNFAGYIDVNITFQKSYVSPGPWIVISKYDNSPYIYEIQSIATGFFTVRIRNASIGQLAPGAGNTQLRFTYMIMN